MNDRQIHLLSLAGTITIIAGSAWMLIGGVVHAISTRRRWVPGSRRMAAARRTLIAVLGPPDLGAPAQARAIRLTAQYMVFRAWLRWAYRLPLVVLVAGELAHLSANLSTYRHHAQVDTWRVVSNGVAFLGSVLLFFVISWMLLAASPRLSLVRAVLHTGAHIGSLTDDTRDLHHDRVLRELGRLEARLTTYFSLAHPAGDRYTRARVVAANNGLYGQLVDVKQSLIFAESVSDVHATGALWNVLAAVAADPTVLAEAEAAAAGSGRVAEAPPARRVYRAAAVVTVLLVIAGIVALWWADHSALSVIFSAVVAPLLLPAIIGLSRRGWSRSEGASGGAASGAPEGGSAPGTSAAAGSAAGAALAGGPAAGAALAGGPAAGGSAAGGSVGGPVAGGAAVEPSTFDRVTEAALAIAERNAESVEA